MPGETQKLMPLILMKPGEEPGRRDVLIVLGPENIERIKEKDPFQLDCETDLPVQLGKFVLGVIQISYATDAEMMQMAQLARQGKVDEAVKLATSGWKYRPQSGDHDLGAQLFRPNK